MTPTTLAEHQWLGKSRILVSRLGLGCATFGREISESAAFALMDYAVANGITLFDTAEAYGGGQARAYRRSSLGVDDIREESDEMNSSEKIIGRWIRSRGSRSQITLVTKVTRNFRREAVRAALEASLARLQTDHVDVYLYHSFDRETPPGEAAQAISDVVRDGLTRAGGCSNYSGEQLANALKVSREAGLERFEFVQTACNLLQTQNPVFSVARREGVAIMAYSPLAAGFLSGKYTPNRATIPKRTRFDVIPDHADLYFNERNFQRVERLLAMAKRLEVAPVHLAMAWVLQQPYLATVLVGARTQSHLDNALSALRLPFLPEWLTDMGTWDNLGSPVGD